MAQGKIARLRDGRPIDRKHFAIEDQGLTLTSGDRAAIVRAERALDLSAPFAIAAATRRRLLGAVTAESGYAAAAQIAHIIKELYGDRHERTGIALVANFYPSLAMIKLQGTNARTYLALDSNGTEAEFTSRWACIDDWTKRGSVSRDEYSRITDRHANRRIFLDDPAVFFGEKAKRGPLE